MKLSASSLHVSIINVIIVLLLHVSFTGDLLMASAQKSNTGYYDRAAVAADVKECSTIGTCVQNNCYYGGGLW